MSTLHYSSLPHCYLPSTTFPIVCSIVLAKVRKIMGSSCSGGCCGKPNFRFKNYVVAVYPEEVDGEANLEALSKLRAYVAKNPERIPRVCRKVTKLIQADVQKQRIQRVGVGIVILRDLIEDAVALEYFVPHTLDLSVYLLGLPDQELHTAASDLVAILTYRVAENPQYEPSRRLLASHEGDLLGSLKNMALQGIGTGEIRDLHCRYAALVALGNMFCCLRTSLVDVVPKMVPVALQNLHFTMRDEEALRKSRSELGQDISDQLPPINDVNQIKSVMLPMDGELKDLAYRRACIVLLGALAGSCSNATAGAFVSSITQYLDTFAGWTTQKFAEECFSCVAIALHKRQQLGFSVCHKLLDLIGDADLNRSSSDANISKLEALMHSVTTIVAFIPLTGVRPMLCIDALTTVLRNSTHPDTVYRRAVDCVAAITRRTALQGNSAQLTKVGVELCHSLGRNQPRVITMVGIDALIVAAPYLASLSPVDKHKIGLLGTIRPLLVSSEEPLVYHGAACLSNYVIGPTESPTQLPMVAEELEFCHDWLASQIGKDMVTPRLLMCMADIVLAVVTRASYTALPWILCNLVFDLQDRLETSPASSCSSAWHLFALTVIRCIGIALRLRELTEYAAEILRRRRGADDPEIPPHFHSKFDSHASHCGLKTLVGEEDQPLLQTDSGPAVQFTVSRKTIARYLLGSGDLGALQSAFGTESIEELTAQLEGSSRVQRSESVLSMAEITPTDNGSMSRTLANVAQPYGVPEYKDRDRTHQLVVIRPKQQKTDSSQGIYVGEESTFVDELKRLAKFEQKENDPFQALLEQPPSSSMLFLKPPTSGERTLSPSGAGGTMLGSSPMPPSRNNSITSFASTMNNMSITTSRAKAMRMPGVEVAPVNLNHVSPIVVDFDLY